MKKIKLLCLLPIAAMVLSGCEANIFGKDYKIDWPWEKNNSQEPEQEETQEEEEYSYTFEGLSFSDKTVTYDGQPHTIDVSGIFPPGTDIDYGENGNEFTSVGSYNVTAVVTCDEFKTVTLTATLTIVKADFTGLSLNSSTFTYNGQSHSLNVTGDLPAGTTIDYGTIGHEFTNPGEYHVVATISCEGYNTKVLEADLTILLANFVGLTMEGYSVTYDGQPHSVDVLGNLPQGATISYGSGNSFVDAGSYEITATVSCFGYNDYVLTATLTIEKANLEGITFSNQTFLFDNDSHSIAPNVPDEYAGAVISYDENGNTYSELGSYQVNATVSLNNYNDWHGVAYVIITNFDNLSLNNATVTYDGSFHTLEIEGEVPEGATVSYVSGHEGGTLPDEYEIQIAVSVEGYEPSIFKATLTIEKAHFEGLSFSNSTVDYNGEPQSIEVSGDIPQGAIIDYGPLGNSFIVDGSYEINATVSLLGYEDWHGSATLTIVPLEFSGISLNDDSVLYDEQPHTIELDGTLPAGATYDYVDGYEGGSDPGIYTIKVIVSREGYKDLELTAKLLIYVEPYLVADFENLDNNQLNDELDFKVFKSDWVTPSAGSIVISDNQHFGDGLNTMKMNLKHGNAYKVTRTLPEPLTKKYSGVAIDTLVDDYSPNGTTKIAVQIWVDNLPLPNIPAIIGYKRTYVTYTLENVCPSNWTHWEIPFNDESMSICSGSVTREMLDMVGVDLDEIIDNIYQYITDVAVIVTPNYVDGGTDTVTYVDNVKLITAPEKVKVQSVNVDNKVYTVKSTDDTVLRLDLNNNEASLKTLNLRHNISLEGTYEVSGDDLTINVSPDNGLHSSDLHFQIKSTGATLECLSDLTIDELFADFKEHVDLTDKKFNEVVVVDDFESYESTGVGFDKSNYDSTKDPIGPKNPVSGLRGAYYGDMYDGASKIGGPIDSGWKIMNAVSGAWLDYMELDSTGHSGNCMKVRNKNGNQARYMSYGLMSGEAKPVGRGSTFSFYVKGSIAGSMNIRVYYVNKINTSNQGSSNDGSSPSSSDFTYLGNIPVTTSWTQVEVPIKSTRSVYGFQFRPTQADSRLFIDDVEIYSEGNPHACFVPETIKDGTFSAEHEEDNLRLEVSNNVSSADFYINNQKIQTLSAVMDDGEIVFKDTTQNGELLTIKTTIVGGELHITSVTGQVSSQFSYLSGMVFVKNASYFNDFQNLTPGGKYNDDHWTQQYQGENGILYSTSGQMNVRNAGNNIYCNMTTGAEKNYVYTYTNVDKLGLANKFSVEVKNDFNGCADIKLKVLFITKDDEEVYAIGDADNYVTISAGSAFRKLEATNFGDINVKSIRFIVKSTRSSYDYLYFDNISLSYEQRATYTVVNFPSWWTNDNAHIYVWAYKEGNQGHWYEGVKDGNNFVFTLPSEANKAIFVRVSGTISDLSTWDGSTFNGMSKWNRSEKFDLSGVSSTISPTLKDWFEDE